MKDRVDTSNDVLNFLYDRIDYERKDTPLCNQSFKLDRMRDLMRRLGDPQDHLKIVHIAGTKGKGSTAHMIAAVLNAAGLRYGLYTSPHLETLEERFIVDGQICSSNELTEIIGLIHPVVQEMDRLAETEPDSNGKPTFFEITTAIALLYFFRQDVDLAIIEVGLGGRLDSTNICKPCVSVITSISYDHVHLLGDTLELIATEKAGIIKENVPVISGVEQDGPREVIQRIAEQRDAPIWTLHEDFHVQASSSERKNSNLSAQQFDWFLEIDPDQQRWSDLPLALRGAHQLKNAAVALATLARLQQQGWEIPPEAFQHGLANVHCPARIEVISKHPTVVIDTAHNPASVASLVQHLKDQDQSPRQILVFAASGDKDLTGMFELLLPCFDVIILTRFVTNPRALAIEQLETECQSVIDQFDPETPIPFIESSKDPQAAWQRARQLAEPDDLICVTGSFYLAGEIRSMVIGNTVSRVTS